MRSFKVTYMVVAFLATGSMPIAVAAQSDSSNQNVQELREQMNKLQARLGEFGEEQSDEGCHPPGRPVRRSRGHNSNCPASAPRSDLSTSGGGDGRVRAIF